MSFFGIDTWEFVVLIFLAAFLIGPERLPRYLNQLKTWIRQARDFSDGAKSQLKAEMGPEFEDVNWRQYDPRQYDPRKIVREAFFDEPANEPDAAPDEADAQIDAPAAQWAPVRYDPDRRTPFDVDAT